MLRLKGTFWFGLECGGWKFGRESTVTRWVEEESCRWWKL